MHSSNNRPLCGVSEPQHILMLIWLWVELGLPYIYRWSWEVWTSGTPMAITLVVGIEIWLKNIKKFQTMTIHCTLFSMKSVVSLIDRGLATLSFCIMKYEICTCLYSNKEIKLSRPYCKCTMRRDNGLKILWDTQL